mgnify:CR=1 FL=1
MNKERRDAIVTDLLLRRPKGDEGIEPAFEEYEEYCYDANKDKKYIRCHHEGWGYTAETLFQLGFASHGEVQRWVLRKFYKAQSEWDLTSGQKAGCTRKSKRIWGRISPSIQRIQREGRPGVYRISNGYYSNTIGTVYATDHEDAMKLAHMFYGYLLSDEDNRVKSTFIKMGGIEQIQGENQSVIEEIKNEVKRTEARIKAQQEEIARKLMQIDAITMLQMHTLSQMTTYEPSELLEEDTRDV